MRQRTRRQAGVTLLELLLAVTLVSLLSVGMLMTLRIGLQAMDRVNSRFYAGRKVLGAQHVLEQQLAGLVQTKAECRASDLAPGNLTPFFQGESDTMRFVSTFSLQQASRGAPQLLEFKVIPGDRGVGVRLIVNEIPYAGPKLLGRFCLGMAPDPITNRMAPMYPPVQVSEQSFVLADQLAYCRFVYKLVPPPPEPEKWLPRWLESNTVPRAIRIEMAPLHPDASQLPLLTVTAPIHVNRNLDLKYED